MDLIPEIRKYFSFNCLKAVGEPKRIKRLWLSIIKQLTKLLKKIYIGTSDNKHIFKYKKKDFLKIFNERFKSK